MTDDADRRDEGDGSDEAGGASDEAGGGNGDGAGNRRGGGDGDDGGGTDADANDVSTVERAMTVVSVAVTLALLGLVVWQSMTAPTDVQPRVGVVGVENGSEGRVEVAVELVNVGSVGLDSATVEVACGSQPRSVTFEHVPASGRRQATVVCPAGTTEPNVSVTSWQEA